MKASESFDQYDAKDENFDADRPLRRRSRSKKWIATAAVTLILVLTGVALLFRQSRLSSRAPSETLVVPIVRESPVTRNEVSESQKPQTANERNTGPLNPAPDPRLVEQSRFGIIPKISSEGLKPFEIYSRPMVWSKIAGPASPETDLRLVESTNPKIGIIVSGAGLSYLATVEALIALPANVTFAFSPYANNAGSQVADARRDGHEVMLEIPMDSLNPRLQDPGRMALLTELETEQNLERLSWLMTRFTGYFATIPVMGERFLSQPEKLSPIIQDLSKRGLAIVYATDSPILEQLSHDFQIPYARTTVQIDAELDPISIRNKLANLENAAKMNGYAIGIMRPISMTTRQLETWIKSLADKAIELVPVSSILVSRAKQK